MAAVLKGVAASPGIGIGRAVLWDKVRPRRKAAHAAGPEQELARLEAAVEAARRQLGELMERVRSRTGAKEAAIFKAQLLMLDDPVFLDPAREGIRADGICAEEAVDRAVKPLVERFRALPDDLLKERATDIEDLAQRVLSSLDRTVSSPTALPPESAILARVLMPSEAGSLDPAKVRGLVTEEGGRTGHTALLARAMNIPAALGVAGVLEQVREGDWIIVDGDRGEVTLRPDDSTLELYRRRAATATLAAIDSLPVMTGDGFRVEVAANVNLPREIALARSAGAEGIGLFRTEFLFLNRETQPSEEEQFACYQQTLAEMAPSRVVIRTMDLGGEKDVPWCPCPPEPNPALGLRAIRLSLSRRDIFERQLRAIFRAAPSGNLAILLPMISDLEQVRSTKRLIRELPGSAGVPLGVMIETPAAALLAEELAEEVDFFSIGTNDLIQYVLAVDRLNERVAELYEPFHPAVLRLIRNVCAAAGRKGKWVGVCGEMAADPEAVAFFVGVGVSELSVSPGLIPRIRELVSQLRRTELIPIVEQVLKLSTASEVRQVLRRYLTEGTGEACSPGMSAS